MAQPLAEKQERREGIKSSPVRDAARTVGAANTEEEEERDSKIWFTQLWLKQEFLVSWLRENKP
ncbi:MAG: hypothetical protein ACHBN1_37910 [Heteroscytonema crispum UTEX LB 1556]